MAERKAINKYYPPDWDPSKGSINRYRNSHPLRARARKIDQGILVVRFGMPFNIWCLKCENHIGMGVRYNAEKSKVGNYYSSPIFKFRMKCHLCDNYFEIQTDPSKFDYVVVSGARKQARSTDEEGTAEDIKANEEEEKRRLTDAMFRLEKKVENKIESDAQLPNLHELKRWRARWQDSFSANQLIRKQYRERRKKIDKVRETNKQLLSKCSLKIPLVEADPDDKLMAKEMASHCKSNRLIRSEESKKLLLINSSFTTRSNDPKQLSQKTKVKSQINIKCSVVDGSKKIKSEYG